MTHLAAQLDALLAGAPGTWAVALSDGRGATRYARNQDLTLPSASLIKVPLAWHLLGKQAFVVAEKRDA